MMKHGWILLSLLSFRLLAGEPQPPVAEKIPIKLTKHGDTRIDNYFWMKEKSNPKVLEYLRAENAYTESVMKPTEELQEKLYKEMRLRMKEEDQSVPYTEKNYQYYSRTFEGKAYSVYYRKKNTEGAKEEVLLDVNEIAKGFDYFYASAPVDRKD